MPTSPVTTIYLVGHWRVQHTRAQAFKLTLTTEQADAIDAIEPAALLRDLAGPVADAAIAAELLTAAELGNRIPHGVIAQLNHEGSASWHESADAYTGLDDQANDSYMAWLRETCIKAGLCPEEQPAT